MQILSAPSEVLSQKAASVKKIDKSILSLIEQMIRAMERASDPVGVGLAAPQVGKSLQIFIAKPKINSPVFIFINPKIVWEKPVEKGKRQKYAKKLEGCLSLKDIWGEVERFPQIRLQYLDGKARKHTKNFSGFLGTIIQHEFDHLNGILFPKRVLEQKGTLYKSTKDKKGKDIFEELKI